MKTTNLCEKLAVEARPQSPAVLFRETVDIGHVHLKENSRL